jgi:hypothetical protein
MARDKPIRRGRKNDEQVSMIIPRLANMKPIFAEAHATRMLAGRVIVIPTPTAGPLMAAMVGFEQLCIARETLPPLFAHFSELLQSGNRTLRTHLDDPLLATFLFVN